MELKVTHTWWWFWLPVIVWMGVIFYFSSLSQVASLAVVWWDLIMKKTAHLSEYAILYWLWRRALVKSGANRRWVDLIALGIGVIYACSDELHQSLTPFRHPQLTDVGIDTVGMWIALLMQHRLI